MLSFISDHCFFSFQVFADFPVTPSIIDFYTNFIIVREYILYDISEFNERSRTIRIYIKYMRICLYLLCLYLFIYLNYISIVLSVYFSECSRYNIINI